MLLLNAIDVVKVVSMTQIRCPKPCLSISLSVLKENLAFLGTFLKHDLFIFSIEISNMQVVIGFQAL